MLQILIIVTLIHYRYYVNKKVLFSYQSVAEKFLQQLTALFVSSHYKNSPNDLLMLADAPSHHLFCLLPPINKKVEHLSDVLCVIQVCSIEILLWNKM